MPVPWLTGISLLDMGGSTVTLVVDEEEATLGSGR